MKILFINAIDYNSEVESRYPNLGIGYLISSIKKQIPNQDFNIRVIHKNIPSVIDDFRPNFICLTFVTQNYHLAIEYAKYAKEKDIPVMAGGIHISSLPESLSDYIDFACIGEGERTFPELVELFIKDGCFSKERLKDIDGLIFKESGKTIFTKTRKNIEILDEIPLPDRSYLNITSHSYMFSSRGCPYNCIFCASTEYWKKVRYFSAEYVVNEIDILVNKYNVTFISFFDDLFIANKTRLVEIRDLLVSKSWHKKVRFSCSARANLINDEILEILKNMRMSSVGMGLESGCDKTLKFLKGSNISVEKNINALKLLNKYKISANASFVIGSPNETIEDINQTYNFIKKNPIKLFDTYILTPFPGTKIWHYASEKGLVSLDMDWKNLNVNFKDNLQDAIIVSEELSKDELVKIYKKFEKLRIIKAMLNIWFTPQLFDLPKYITKSLRKKIINVIKTVGKNES